MEYIFHNSNFLQLKFKSQSLYGLNYGSSTIFACRLKLSISYKFLFDIMNVHLHIPYLSNKCKNKLGLPFVDACYPNLRSHLLYLSATVMTTDYLLLVVKRQQADHVVCYKIILTKYKPIFVFRKLVNALPLSAQTEKYYNRTISSSSSLPSDTPTEATAASIPLRCG